MKRTLLFIMWVLASITMMAQGYFPTGMKWEEVNVDPSMELEYENAHIYEIGADTLIGNVTYKKVLKDNVFSGICIRESGDKVWLLTKEYPTEFLLYDFDWDSNKEVETEYLKSLNMEGNDYALRKETIPMDKCQDVTINGKTYQYYRDSFIRSQIRGIGKVAELNRYPCLLGYKENAVISPGLVYFKVHWIQRNGEEIFRSDDAKEWTSEDPRGNAWPDDDYIPFVELGKEWHVVNNPTNPYVPCRFQRFKMNQEVERDGKTYVNLVPFDDVVLDTLYQEAGLFREENRRVYKYQGGRDVMLYDFSLKEGDTFTYEYETGLTVNCKVLKQGWLDDGPEIMTSENKYRKLHTWTIGFDNGSGGYNEAITWIEGIGTLRNMFFRLGHFGVMSCLAYIERDMNKIDYSKNAYLPFSLYNMYGPVYGCDLPTGAKNNEEDWRHHLTYELENDRLHVFGDVLTQCGPNNYAYFYEKPTDDPLVHKIEFSIQEVEPTMDCMALHETDFYVSGFDSNLNYIVVDNYGEEHPVINKTPQMAYRPFVEEGKVWKVGDVTSGNPVPVVDYYYFDGDTIVDGKTCKQMMRQRYVNPDYAETHDLSQDHIYVGAWYEEDKKVYFFNAANKQFKLMYDFSINANDTLQIDLFPYVIGPRKTGGIKGFKGVYREVWECGDDERIYRCAPWMEGVGIVYGPPTLNVFNVELADPMWYLMECYVGDEVIYLNDVEDGATPAEARKQRIDFTHTTKIKPKTRPEVKARTRNEAEQSLYGDYNEQQLRINLNPINDVYMVSITDESGNAVYEKSINAGSIVGLNIDISTYPKGDYTVTVENNNESFIGEFKAQLTGIDEVKSQKSEVRGFIYNLQGRRLSSLQKGLNIVNGRKVLVR